MEMHVIQFRNLWNLPYRCELCGRTFNTESALQEHINREHSGLNDGAGSGELRKYEDYLKDDSYRCEWCGGKFNTQSALQAHINREHTDRNDGAGSGKLCKYEDYLKDDSYRCEWCGGKFNTESALQAHINREHTDRNDCSGESFKYEEYGITCGERYNADQNIVLSSSISCKMCARFTKVRTDLEKSKELKSGKKN
ncbi:zinc finger protein 100-like [Centruroides sculpturatus]|uniref:zinc finger protein 100-like n=1 Tax=Centruroides sculpturatus TaxID=218467 RepID=UPI000C6D6C4D|nr:zinc finger protein 100-like [Centruroides sculpturatus]